MYTAKRLTNPEAAGSPNRAWTFGRHAGWAMRHYVRPSLDSASLWTIALSVGATAQYRESAGGAGAA
jgi:hypothetical protein